METFDRFEVGGRLAGRQAAGRSVVGKDAVLAAFETVRSVGKVCGEISGAAVEIRGAALGDRAGHGELGADEKAVGCRAGSVE